ncbi:hypothetical protein BJ875DRAFT_481320 [Amylocarpus encephaloides]|uniref:Uncharacterized protein n=1 Tax=Amylocarpus encephaloides TaxID=45428 RepID=A0A9P8C8G5_9HELO|nr:hypothetical protein BJ875DRAFT_481320 [Amylocarpus encephaloides]
MRPHSPLGGDARQSAVDERRLYDDTPEFVQPEKQFVSMTQFDHASKSQDSRGKWRSYARRRKHWVIFASVAAVVILAVLFGVIGHLVAKVNSHSRSSTAAPASSQSNGGLPATSLVSPASTSQVSVLTLTPTSAGKTTSSTSSAARSTSTLSCGALASCDAAGCNGFNSQEATYGQCQAGTEKGCPCITLCGPLLGPCAGCGGLNGTCVDLPYAGCGCFAWIYSGGGIRAPL